MKKHIIFTLVLSLSLVASLAKASFLSSVATLGAITLPGYITYYLMADRDAKAVKQHAEQIVYRWKNAQRVYTMDEVNNALDRAEMTEDELQKEIRREAIASGFCTSLLAGTLYYILRYCEPSYGVEVRLPITSPYYYRAIPAPFPPR